MDWSDVEPMAKNMINANHYRFRSWEFEDLLQEAQIVCLRCIRKYTDEEVLAYAAKHGSIKNPERVLMRSRVAFFRTSLMNRLNSIAALVATRVPQATVEVQETVDWLLDSRAVEAAQWEVAHDIQRSPGVMAVLERASWENASRLTKTPKVRKDGKRETTDQVLCRLGKLPEGSGVAAELAAIVDTAF